MKLNYFRGCINDSLEIDNIDSEDLSTDKLLAVIKKCFSRQDLVNAISNHIELYGEEVEFWNCDQCGDINILYELIVE